MKLRFQYVLFDLGNTLLYYDAPWPDSLDEAIQALTRYLISHNFPISEKPFQSAFRERLEQYYVDRDVDCIEFSTQDVLRKFLYEQGVYSISNEIVRGALSAMYRVSQSYWKPEADAIPTLEMLKHSGYQLGLVTNASDSDDVNALVDKAVFRSYFDVIVISADIGLRKPHPRIFNTALKFWDAQPDQAVMIGDLLPADILGANELGIASVWITRRASKTANNPYLESVKPDAVINSLAELPSRA